MVVGDQRPGRLRRGTLRRHNSAQLVITAHLLMRAFIRGSCYATQTSPWPPAGTSPKASAGRSSATHLRGWSSARSTRPEWPRWPRSPAWPCCSMRSTGSTTSRLLGRPCSATARPCRGRRLHGRPTSRPHRTAQAALGWRWTHRPMVTEGGHHQACIVDGKRHGGGMYCVKQQIPSRHDLRQLVGRASR